MKKVLIALDYNPTAQKVAETGFALAKAMEANLMLLHVVPDNNYYATVRYAPFMGFDGYTNMGYPQSDLGDELRQQSLIFLNKTKRHLGSVNIETFVRQGSVSDAIMETVASTNADVVVMGSHSRRWLEAVMLGSVTAKVLRQTQVPLFIVPTNDIVPTVS